MRVFCIYLDGSDTKDEMIGKLLITINICEWTLDDDACSGRISRVWEIVGLNPGRDKPMTYQLYTCRFLARYPALLG